MADDDELKERRGNVTDTAINQIRDIPIKQLNFQWFRSIFRSDNGLKDSLASGHAVIDSVDQLNQYLHTYGLMIKSQWEHTAHFLAGTRQPTLCIDYGCGQGLAGLMVNDLTSGSLLAATRDIALIEPSSVALARSAALYGRIASSAIVASISKRFDDVLEADLPLTHPTETLHLFSNSLDVRGFDPLALLRKTMRPGRHTVLSVSHDRAFNGGTPQIEQVKAAFEGSFMAPALTIYQSTLERFTCDNPGRSKGVVWFCELELTDG